MFHPLFGLNLKKPILAIPFHDTFSGCVGIGMLIHRMYTRWEWWTDIHYKGNLQLYYFEMFIWIAIGVGSVLMIGFAKILWNAVKSKNITLLNVWVIITGLLSVYAIMLTFTSLIFFRETFDMRFAIMSTFTNTIKLYMCYTVRYYAKELKHEREMKSAVRPLTKDEVEDFENGIPIAINEVVEGNIQNLALYSGYQKHFEIDMNRLSIGWNNPLGKGEFGTVYKGHLDDNNYSTAVAVKVIDPEATDACSFKLMLSELKVMTHVGEHPNVVRLIGANTSEIHQRKLYIVMEFCSFGNVLDVLRGSRGLFVNFGMNGITIEREDNKLLNTSSSLNEDSISTFDLVRWSHQIATGMEFLASKRLVHGDLAARNVLLTEDKVVKITDFGLSRQLYQYSVYVKKSSQPVPWMNLSLESIIDQQFSTHSDVWSYGITLWEMFSLGEVPYPAYTFGNQFIKELRDGMRPSCPPYSPHFMWDIWYELMQMCWKQDPKHRPTFSEIQQSLISYS